MAASSNAGDNSNWAIAVVHGIGTPEPGETRDAVCSSIRAVCPDFVPMGASGEGAKGSPPIQNWKFGNGGRARVAETFWGDLSLVRGTVPDMIRAICINLFGAVYVNSRTLQGTSAFTRHLPIIPFYLIRWIVLPLHVVAIFLVLPVGFRFWDETRIPQSAYLTTNLEWFLVSAALGAIASLGLMIWLLLRQRNSVRPQPWDMAFSLFVLFALSALAANEAVADWFRTCVATYSGRNPRGFGMILQGVLRGEFAVSRDLCQLVLANTPIELPQVTGVGRYLALNELLGDAVFYLCACMLLLYLFIALLNWIFRYTEAAKTMLFVATISLLFVVASAILLEVFDFATRAVQFHNDFYTYWYEFGFVVWLIIVAAGAALSLALRRRRQRAMGKAHEAGTLVDTYARLIVSETFQVAVVIATLAFIVALLANEAIEDSYRLQNLGPQFKLLAPALAISMLLIVIYFRELRLGLDIAMDVINHFVWPHRGFPVRRRISERFHASLDALLEEGAAQNPADKPHLLVIAHSQGSVIVIDALAKSLWDRLGNQVASMTVLTFGSPFTHIYQYYFPLDYCAVGDTALGKLADDARVQWVNVYRADDPVGTVISGPTKRFPQNLEMAVGGHTRYWREDIFRVPELRMHLPGAA